MKLEDDICSHYLNLDFSENFLCDDSKIQIQLPYPVNKPLQHSKIDAIGRYNEDLETYNHQLITLRKEFQLVKNKILDQTFSGSHGTVTKGLLNFCNKEKLETPFSCDYNPYYATGLLEHFSLNGSNYFIRPDCNNVLCINNLAKPWKNYKLNVEKPLEDTITGISINNHLGPISLLIKQKNQINLGQIEDIKSVARINFTKNFKLEVVDAKLGKSQVGVVLSNKKFRLYDVETNKKIDLTAFDVDQATSFQFIDDQNVAILSQKNIKLLDLRSPDDRSFEPKVGSCDYLSCARITNDLLYLGTRHHFIRTDERFFKNVEFCTHLMKCSPCYMEHSGDFLCLSGQKHDEKVLFCGNPISSLPVDVPNICNSLNRCRLVKDHLLRDEIGERLQKSTGGVKLISDDMDTFLYSVNCLGDVYKQKIINTWENDELESIEHLDRWLNNLPQSPKPLHLTNVVNMSEARFSLNKSLKRDNLRKFANKPKTSYFLSHLKNRYHKDKLGELAANFASIWEEDEEEKEEVDLVPEVAPLDKVSDWIESSYFFE